MLSNNIKIFVIIFLLTINTNLILTANEDNLSQADNSDSIWAVNNYFSIVPAKVDQVNGWAFGAIESHFFSDSIFYPKLINGFYSEISPITSALGLLFSLQATILVPFYENTYYFSDEEIELCKNINTDSLNYDIVNGLSILAVSYRSAYKLNGLSLNCVNITCEHINGLNLTATVNGNTFMNGMTISGVINNIYQMNGISISGFVNRAYKARGLQIGLINIAYQMKGLQIGLWNVIGGKGFPIINLSL